MAFKHRLVLVFGFFGALAVWLMVLRGFNMRADEAWLLFLPLIASAAVVYPAGWLLTSLRG